MDTMFKSSDTWPSWNRQEGKCRDDGFLWKWPYIDDFSDNRMSSNAHQSRMDAGKWLRIGIKLLPK